VAFLQTLTDGYMTTSSATANKVLENIRKIRQSQQH
jgi:hypothetical protein